jgi:hypothetical protein
MGTIQAESKPVVLIEGDGIAAVCVARLLTDAGVACVRQPNERPKLAAILVGEQTQHLLRELFPATETDPEDLFEGLVQIKRRVVLWGDAPQALELPHSGVVAPEGDLLRRLWGRVPPMATLDASPGRQPSLRVQTTRADAISRPEQGFGNREASFALVELHAGIAPDACWVESIAHGWLFLLALGGNKATLIAVGDNSESLLIGSRLVALQIAGTVAHHASVPAYPRLTSTLANAQSLTCGSAAMSFDPLCGEGAGNAVREAFLAAAVIRASVLGRPWEPLAEHYTDRLRRGFLRHLQLCLQFYSTGGQGPFWKTAEASLVAGIQDLAGLVRHEPTITFRLLDRDLVPAEGI